MQPSTFGEPFPGSEEYELFDLDISDDKLQKMLVKSLQSNVDHWNTEPFCFDKTDEDNLRYLMGDQLDRKYLRDGEKPVIDNRMFTATRAVLAYVNARVATPEVAPSSSDKKAIKFAQDLKEAMYQHGVDNKLDRKAKAATKNLVVRKRGFLKVRFDPTVGPYGDIVVDVIDPADIIVDRYATYLNEPPRIDHKQRCTVEELIAKFPKKKKDILAALGMKRGVYSQTTRQVTYYESWFTYFDKQSVRRQGVAWYMLEGSLILGKMPNPNWIYTGDDAQDRIVNYTKEPVKPFIVFNYLNNGRSYLDETSLFDQGRPMQKAVNERMKQIKENADYANGRWVADSSVLSETDATKFVNKNPKTILLVNAESKGTSVNEAVKVFDPTMLPQYVVETLYDGRNEIDQIMGTPNIFRGEQSKNNTLGQDERIIQQAGALQDDLATAVDDAMGDYYCKLAQMMKVYFTEDHWIDIKGDDGKYDHIVLNSETMEPVKVSVESGSTLPSNKQELRDTVIAASKEGRIDNLSFWEGLIYNKLPDPETIVERLIKETNDPATYLSDVEQEAFNRDADIDIAMLVANKAPKERDDYPQGYLEHFNKFIMSNKYTTVPQDAQQRISLFLSDVAQKAMRTAELGDTQVDDAAASGQTEAQVMEEEPAIV